MTDSPHLLDPRLIEAARAAESSPWRNAPARG